MDAAWCSIADRGATSVGEALVVHSGPHLWIKGYVTRLATGGWYWVAESWEEFRGAEGWVSTLDDGKTIVEDAVGAAMGLHLV